MDDLIEALLIFKKYKNVKDPTCCSHDVLSIVEVTEEEVTEADKIKLDNLGFIWSEESDTFCSFRFGSA